MKAFISGPFRGTGEVSVNKNIRNAQEVADYAYKQWGWTPIVPHSMFFGMWDETDGLTCEEILELCLDLVGMCDNLIVLPGWSKSEGTMREIIHAKSLHMPIIYMKQIFARGSVWWKVDYRLEPSTHYEKLS